MTAVYSCCREIETLGRRRDKCARFTGFVRLEFGFGLRSAVRSTIVEGAFKANRFAASCPLPSGVHALGASL